jgi:hypothetical protein
MAYINSEYNDAKINDYLVVISGGGVNLGGVLSTDTLSLSMGMSATDSVATSNVEGGIRGVGKAVAGKIAGNLGKSLVDSAPKRVGSTVKTYGETSETSFSIDIDIIPGKYNAPGSYNGITNQIAKMTQPKFTSADVMVSYLYDPGVVSSLLTNPRVLDHQLLHVTIGNWFAADGLFCTSANPSYSTIIDDTGKPLFMTASFTFTPYRMLDADELSSWIKQ